MSLLILWFYSGAFGGGRGRQVDAGYFKIKAKLVEMSWAGAWSELGKSKGMIFCWGESFSVYFCGKGIWTVNHYLKKLNLSIPRNILLLLDKEDFRDIDQHDPLGLN
jgi:hypothetical protein